MTKCLHIVETDICGIGRERKTCLICQKTIIEQPYLSEISWRALVKKFELEECILEGQLLNE